MATRKKRRTVPNETIDSSSIELTAAQLKQIERDYDKSLARNKALLDEVIFILAERISSAEIKIHGIEKRIKSIGSVVDKCKRKGTSNFNSLNDVVGSRVVCLFRSDMSRIDSLIRENFEVVEVDDKIDAGAGPLGYQSVHYQCKMPSRYKGPRYENTSNLIFEVQVRTLCMHAWAAVSHHLDYKGDWDVPVDLKRALSALSGLFYVADNEFEQFYAARIQSREKAGKYPDAAEAKEINLDTVQAYLRTKFPLRMVVDADSDAKMTAILSQFVQELKLAGFKSLGEVNDEIDKGKKAFEAYSADYKANYSAVGAARISLALVSPAFFNIREKAADTAWSRRMRKHRVAMSPDVGAEEWKKD